MKDCTEDARKADRFSVRLRRGDGTKFRKGADNVSLAET
jgi:hypothetical protein